MTAAPTTEAHASAPAEPAPARRRRVPAPLAWLLATTLLLGVAWALVTPAFQAPDENSHYGYVQSLADGPGLPGQAGRPPFSTEQLLAADNSNADQAAAQPQVTMEWSRQAYERWRARQRRLPAGARSDGGGPNPASSNPPLYYLYAVPFYAAAGGDPFDRLLATRLASVLWLLVTVAAVWLLAGEALGRDRLPQLAAASVAALAPMMTFVSASVTPDAMMYALWSLVLWLGVRVLRRGLTWPQALALFALAGAACAVKGTSYGLLPGALLVLAVGLWRLRPRRVVPAVASVAAAVAGLALTLGVWKLVANASDRATSAQLTAATSTAGGLNVRMLLSYLWQFYLPRLPFQSQIAFTGTVPPVYFIWLKGSWGAFGWLEVKLPGAVYNLLAAATVAVSAAAAAALWRVRRRLDRAVVAFLALVPLTLLAGLHWTEYQQIAAGAGPINQGRYLLPVVGVAGLALALALRRVPARARGPAVGAVLGGLLVLQLLSLGLMLERFYA